MKEIKVYLCHYDSILLIDLQMKSIKKHFKVKDDEKLIIYGTVDASNKDMCSLMRTEWIRCGAIPLEMPYPHLGLNDKGEDGPSKSFGMCFDYIMDTYIKKDTYISLLIENDVVFYNDLNISDYSDGYQVCGDVRFYGHYLPFRLLQFWLGFVIFNHRTLKNIDLFRGVRKPIEIDGKMYNVDCGGHTYNWIKETPKSEIRIIDTTGIPENYDPYTWDSCLVHNITTDVHNLPEQFREGYMEHFRVVNYDNLFIHLERIPKVSFSEARQKINWIAKHY